MSGTENTGQRTPEDEAGDGTRSSKFLLGREAGKLSGAGSRGGRPRSACFGSAVTVQARVNCPVPRFPRMLGEDAHGACPTGRT